MDEEEKTSLWQRMVEGFAVRGLWLIAVLFVIEVALFFIVANTPLLPGEQQSYLSQSRHLAQTINGSSILDQGTFILGNNLRVALIEMIPVLGAVFFGASIYETARIVQVLAISRSIPPTAIVLSLFLLPHSWIELPAYSVATAEGIYLLRAVMMRVRHRATGGFGPELEQLLANLILVSVILAVAAVFEAIELQLGLAGLVMWLPFALLLVFVVVLKRRLDRVRSRVLLARASVPREEDRGEQ